MLDITQILRDVQAGRVNAPDELAAALYEELRAVARHDLAGERAGHTLQPTALANEAWLRLFNGQESGFENRAHFFAAASTAIRRVLADHARRRQAAKRGGGAGRIPLEAVDLGGPVRSEVLLAMDEALERLASFAPLQARIIEMRFFGGMTMPELARVLSISVSTVERHWTLARAWLRSELEDRHGA